MTPQKEQFSKKKKALAVVVHTFPPLVMKEKGKYTGFEIELWEEIAKELNADYAYYEEPMLSDIFPALIEGRADVALAGITLTEEREKIIDFSHHTFDSGLHILVQDKTKQSILSIVKMVFTQNVRKILLLLLAFIFVAGHVLWLAERGSMVINDNYFPGIFDALWWAIVTVSTVGYGDITPVTGLGRFVGALVIFSGFVIFGLYIARISSAMTLLELKSDISGPKDLRDKHVATVQGTTSMEALRQLDARIVAVEHIEKAYMKLEGGEVEAVIFDAPVLLYYVNTRGAGKVRIAGNLFEPQSYGIAFKEGGELREKVNRVLLKLRETGFYDSLYKKWFGG